MSKVSIQKGRVGINKGGVGIRKGGYIREWTNKRVGGMVAWPGTDPYE